MERSYYNNNNLIKQVLDFFENEATKENEHFNGMADDGVTYQETYYNSDNTYWYQYMKVNHSPWMGNLSIPVLEHGINIYNPSSGVDDIGISLSIDDKSILIKSNFLEIDNKKTKSKKVISFNEKEKLMGYYNTEEEYGFVFKNNEFYGIVPREVARNISTYENIDKFYGEYFIGLAAAGLISYEEMASLFDSNIGKNLEPHYLEYQLKLLPKTNVTKFINAFEVRNNIFDFSGRNDFDVENSIAKILTEFENIKTGEIVFRPNESITNDGNSDYNSIIKK